MYVQTFSVHISHRLSPFNQSELTVENIIHKSAPTTTETAGAVLTQEHLISSLFFNFVKNLESPIQNYNEHRLSVNF